MAEVIKLPSADTNFANIILFNTEDEKQGPININNKILEEIAKNMDAPIIPQVSGFNDLSINVIYVVTCFDVFCVCVTETCGICQDNLCGTISNLLSS